MTGGLIMVEEREQEEENEGEKVGQQKDRSVSIRRR